MPALEVGNTFITDMVAVHVSRTSAGHRRRARLLRSHLADRSRDVLPDHGASVSGPARACKLGTHKATSPCDRLTGSLLLDELDLVIQAAVDGAGLAPVTEDRSRSTFERTLVRVLEEW